MQKGTSSAQSKNNRMSLFQKSNVAKNEWKIPLLSPLNNMQPIIQYKLTKKNTSPQKHTTLHYNIKKKTQIAK